MESDSESGVRILRGDDEIIARTTQDRYDNRDEYVYREVPESDGDYVWDHEADGTVDEFPSAEIEVAVEDEIPGEVVDHFPLTVTIHASEDSNTRQMCKSAGLPVDDDELTDVLWYYPGEFTITYTIEEDATRGYDVTAEEIEYEGKTFTPE